MKLGLLVRIMPTSKRASSWIGEYGITTKMEGGEVNIRLMYRHTTLTHYTLWVEPRCLEII